MSDQDKSKQEQCYGPICDDFVPYSRGPWVNGWKDVWKGKDNDPNPLTDNEDDSIFMGYPKND